MMFRLFLALVALCLPVAAQAHDLEGRWAFRINETTIFVFELDENEYGEWFGRWLRPERFSSNGVVFARLVGSREIRSSAGIEFEGAVELTFDDPRPNAIPDIFAFRHTGPGQAQMTYVGTPLAPFPLIAVSAATGLGPFEEGRVYDRDNAVTAPGEWPLPVELAAPEPAPAQIAPPAAQGPAPAPEPDREAIGADFLEGL